MSILTTKNALERILDNKKVQKTTTEPKKGMIEKVILKEKEPLKLTKESIRTTKELIKATKIFKTVNTTTFNNLKEEKEEPLCTLDVKDKNGVYVLKITSGEELTLTLKLNSLRWKQKINNITIFPRKCYAINLDNGGRYCLTDNGGCAFERGLFPEWKRKNNYIAEF
ncbi:ZP domain-containing protein [Meloidogyne graminicola]|uniref:ZP domain-containing protein n=1 Tax=Meloidogyne graminicola TaxID=189291 RepID=A0A8T0A3Q3_9BILA|nr:ZP domain-containing protein [Meloidogyne graminicola]